MWRVAVPLKARAIRYDLQYERRLGACTFRIFFHVLMSSRAVFCWRGFLQVCTLTVVWRPNWQKLQKCTLCYIISCMALAGFHLLCSGSLETRWNAQPHQLAFLLKPSRKSETKSPWKLLSNCPLNVLSVKIKNESLCYQRIVHSVGCTVLVDVRIGFRPPNTLFWTFSWKL